LTVFLLFGSQIDCNWYLTKNLENVKKDVSTIIFFRIQHYQITNINIRINFCHILYYTFCCRSLNLDFNEVFSDSSKQEKIHSSTSRARNKQAIIESQLQSFQKYTKFDNNVFDLDWTHIITETYLNIAKYVINWSRRITHLITLRLFILII